MKNLKPLVLLVGLVFPCMLLAQGETSNWYFGNGAGIQFNIDGTVTAIEDGKLNTIEGCASMSDEDGQLLCYTDGITVYNRNHEIMENGTGLYGNPSSTQSAIIVPKPEDPNILFIFTVDTKITEEEIDRGLNYSVVDISANDGLGAVIEKNSNLLEDCSEKIAAVIKDCSEKSIWIITLASEEGRKESFFNTYHAFEVNSTGILATSVRSTFDDLLIGDPRGYLKLSSDGSMLASANSESGLFLYDFDTETGIVSNQQKIDLLSPNEHAYGIEFSPNQDYLYIHATNNGPPFDVIGNTSYLIQYDVSGSDTNGTQIVLETSNTFRGALQLGENGKIYRTISQNYLLGTSFLGVINNPDENGLNADYVHNAISLNGKIGGQGLPPFIQSFFEKTGLITNEEGNKISALSICETENILLDVEAYQDASYRWEKDGISLSYSGNSYSINSLNITDSGKYKVTITFSDPSICPIIGESLINVTPLPTNETYELTQCDVINPTDGFGIFNLDESFYSEENTYLLYETAQDRIDENPITDTGSYSNTIAFNQTLFYRAINSNGCENFGELRLTVNPSPLSNSADYSFYECDIDSKDNVLESNFNLTDIANTTYNSQDVTFYTSLNDLLLERNELSTQITTGSLTVYARLEDNNQCSGVDVIDLIVNPRPSLEFPDEFLVCTDGSPVEILAPEGFDSYAWTQIKGNQNTLLGVNQNIFISDIGNYMLEVGYEYVVNGEAQFCTDSKEFEVLPSNRAKIDEIIVNDISNNNSIEINVSGDGDYEYSIDGKVFKEDKLFTNILAGFITVFVRDKNGCGVTEELISVIGYPKFFTPNGDGVNDYWQLIGLDEEFQKNSMVTIFDRYGKSLVNLNSNNLRWDGRSDSTTLPETDYWFSATLPDGREFKGHFSLKR